jgi:hypothetical protein
LPRSCLTPAIQADQVEAQKSLQRDLENQEKRQPADTISEPRRK